MKHNQTYHIAIYGLGIAIVFISTMFIQIPIPLGYANLGNCFVFLFAMFLNEKAGFIIGGVGSALADLLSGWSMWAIPTFFLKGLMGYLVGIIGKKEVTSLHSPYLLLASLIGTLEGIIGLVVRLILCVTVSNLVFFLLYRKQPEYTDAMKIVERVIGMIKKKFRMA